MGLLGMAGLKRIVSDEDHISILFLVGYHVTPR